MKVKEMKRLMEWRTAGDKTYNHSLRNTKEELFSSFDGGGSRNKPFHFFSFQSKKFHSFVFMK